MRIKIARARVPWVHVYVRTYHIVPGNDGRTDGLWCTGRWVEDRDGGNHEGGVVGEQGLSNSRKHAPNNTEDKERERVEYLKDC